jgi:hypothetical protein
MGIRFLFEGTQSAEFSKLIDALESKFVRGDVADDLLL